jgi:hypothetical protein
MALSDERLESLALDWIITQIRARREMKNTLPIEGAMTVPLEWAESLANAYEQRPMPTPPPRSIYENVMELVRMIAESDPLRDDFGGIKPQRECRYCDHAIVSAHYTFRPEYRVHTPDCLWVRCRALVAHLPTEEASSG